MRASTLLRLAELLVVLGVLAFVAIATRADERRIGVALAERDSARADGARALQRAREAERARETAERAFALLEAKARADATAYASAVAAVPGLRQRLDSIERAGGRADTVRVEVPISLLFKAGDAVTSCTGALASCGLLRRKVEGERDSWRDVARARARELAAASVIERRPWTSIGPELGIGGVGGYVERDLGRWLRVGGSLTPGCASLRIGPRF